VVADPQPLDDLPGLKPQGFRAGQDIGLEQV
jgi:hypothetical protein